MYELDSLSEKYCGEGVPLWAAITTSVRRYNFPQPLDSPYPLNIPPTNNTSNINNNNNNDINNNDDYRYNNNSKYDIPDPTYCAKNSWQNYYLSASASEAFQNIYSNRFGLLDRFVGYWKKVAQTFGQQPNLLGYELLNEVYGYRRDRWIDR